MDKQKNLIMDDRTWNELKILEEDSGMSASAFIRQLIHEAYEKYLERLVRRRDLEERATR